MAKSRKSLLQREVDAMAIVVFLAIALFAGVAGYLIGQTSALGTIIGR